MSTPTVANSGASDIDVQWIAPNDNGDTIDEYTLQIFNPSTFTYALDVTDCDGTDPLIVAAL